jgi:hypothetical protein
LSTVRPIVVCITSPSYTGTTWINLLLGSHPEAIAVGPPDRIWKLGKGNRAEACRVHGADCSFWPAFLEQRDTQRNFYLQLCEATGRNIAVINNPSDAHRKAELEHPELAVRHVQVIRDGRAVANSYARHHNVDFYDAVTRYARDMYRKYRFEPDREDVLAIRYEQLMESPQRYLPRLRSFIGLDYADDIFEFWK